MQISFVLCVGTPRYHGEVNGGGSGMTNTDWACHGAPVRMIYKMLLNMAWLTTRGLPLPSARFIGLSNDYRSTVSSISSLQVWA